VTPAVHAIVHADARDSVHARIGSRRDRRVPNRSARRDKVNLCMSEPGTALTQGCERWHDRSIPLEVISAHAIQNDQHDNSRSNKIGPQNRQHMTRYGREHLRAERSRKRSRNILLDGRHRVHSRFHRKARKHQGNRDVIWPRRTVHVGRVMKSPSRGTTRSWPLRPGKYARANISRKRCRAAAAAAPAGAVAPLRGASLTEDGVTCWPETFQTIAPRIRASRTAP